MNQCTRWASHRLTKTDFHPRIPGLFGLKKARFSGRFSKTFGRIHSDFWPATVVKGGSWDDKGCGVCRPAARHTRPAAIKHILIGFRLVRGPDER